MRAQVYCLKESDTTMKVTKEINLGGKIFSLETGRFAKQADGAVMARFGDTMVLATVVASKEENDKLDYFPLQVEYRDAPRGGNLSQVSATARFLLIDAKTDPEELRKEIRWNEIGYRLGL